MIILSAPEYYQPDSDHEGHDGEEHDYDHEEHQEYGNHDLKTFINQVLLIGALRLG